MMSNWNQTVWWILYGGVPSAFFAYYGLTPLLRSLGVLTNNPGLITWGDRLSTPTGAFLTGTALIVILVVIFATGMNFYFRIQNVLFVVAMLGVAAHHCGTAAQEPGQLPGRIQSLAGQYRRDP